MIYTQPPAPKVPTTDQLQQTLKTDITSLSDNSIGDYFKGLKLRHYIQTIINKNESLGVTTDVSIMDLQSHQAIINHNLDVEHFAASVNKVPVAELVLNDLRAGKITMDQQLIWTADDVRGGAGTFDQPGAPLQAPLKDVLFDLLNPSGNTAVRILVNGVLGGAVATNDRFKNELHLQHTYLQPLTGNKFYVGNTTARDAMTNIQMLLKGNDQYQKFVQHALATNIYTDYGVRSQLAGNDYIVLANKVGILDDVDANNRHDVGIIYNTKTNKSYAYAFLNSAHGEAYNTATAQAGISLADMGKGLLRFAGDKAPEGAAKAARVTAPDHASARVRY